MNESPRNQDAETPSQPDKPAAPSTPAVPEHVRTEGETGVDDALGTADDPE
jgi:hypothetical protein